MNSDETLLFSVDGMLLNAASSSVHCIHDGIIVQPEPGTQTWFAGIAVVEGRLLPVTDLGAYYERKPSHGPIIEIAHHLGIVGLRVDEVHGVTLNNSENQIDSDAYEFIDIAQLVQSEQFLNIHCEPA